MASYRVELLCMHGLTSDVQIKLPDKDGVTIHTILKPATHDQLVRTEDGDDVEANEAILGFLLTGGPVVQFSPAVEHVAIESIVPNRPESQTQYRETKMLANTQGTTFRRLRDGNILIFRDAELKIRIQIASASIAAPLGTTSHETGNSIQVKSSIPEPERSQSGQVARGDHQTAGNQKENDTVSDNDTDSESEGDFDKAGGSFATPAVRATEITPPTSLRPEEGTVKDTPARPDSHGSNEPFSTAPVGPDGVTSEAQTGVTADRGEVDTLNSSNSPSARAAESQERRRQKDINSQSGVSESKIAPGSIVQESETLAVEDEDIADDGIFAGGSIGKQRGQSRVYGRKSNHRRQKALEVPESPAQQKLKCGSSTPSLRLHDSETASRIDDHSDGNSRDEADFDNASTLSDGNDAAILSTHDSQASHNSKRKLSQIVAEKEPTSGPKRRKATSSATKEVEHSNNTGGEEEIDAVPPRSSKESRAEARKRLLRSNAEDAGDTTPPSAGLSFNESTVSSNNVRPTDIVDEPIAPRSSPQVRIRRLRTSETPASSASPSFTGQAPMVLLSNSQQNNATTTKWLKKQGGKVIDDVPEEDADFVCVIGNGPLMKTSKLLRTITIGHPVLTDQWLIDSKQAGHLLEIHDYLHPDLLHSADLDRSNLFADKTLFFTNRLVSVYGAEGWKNIQLLCQDAGADAFVKGAASKAASLLKKNTNMVIFGHDVGDQDVEPLIKDGHVIFNKDFLTHVIISGTLALDDEEFRLHTSKGAAVGRKGKKK